MSLIELCRKFIAIDSSPQAGTMEAARFSEQVCRDAGFHVELQIENHAGMEEANVIVRPQGKASEGELMLQSHLDTADPGHFSHWTKTRENPFNVSIYGDLIYGLGAAEVKLDWIAKIMAARQFLFKNRVVPLVLLGTFGAESGMTGAVRAVRKKKIRAAHALVGEPTELRVASAGLGLIALEVAIPFSPEEKEYHLRHDTMESSTSQTKFFKGRAAHSSQPQLGESATSKMLEYLSQLPEGMAVMDMEGGTSYNSVADNAVLELDMVDSFKDSIIVRINNIHKKVKEIEGRLKHFPDTRFVPSHGTINIGRIYTTEEHVHFLGSCRLTPTVPLKDAEDWMEELRQVCHEFGAEFTIRNFKKPFQTQTDSVFLAGLCAEQTALSLNNEPTIATATTEASVFHRLGISCAVYGAGRGPGNSHAPNESVSLDQIKKSAEFYARVIGRFCA